MQMQNGNNGVRLLLCVVRIEFQSKIEINVMITTY